MNVHPFFLPGLSQRKAIVQSLRHDIDLWLAEWVGEERASRLSVALREELSESNTDAIRYDGGDDSCEATTVWSIWDTSAESLVRFGVALLGGQQDNRLRNAKITQKFALMAIRDLATALTTNHVSNLTQGSVNELIPESSKKPGCGVFGLSLQIEDESLRFWLPTQALYLRTDSNSGAKIDEADRPIPIVNAVANQRVALRTVLGSIDLSLEALSHLQPGDVVRLDKPITAPLKLCMKNSELAFSGYLGKQADRLAFRIVEQLVENE